MRADPKPRRHYGREFAGQVSAGVIATFVAWLAATVGTNVSQWLAEGGVGFRVSFYVCAFWLFIIWCLVCIEGLAALNRRVPEVTWWLFYLVSLIASVQVIDWIVEFTGWLLGPFFFSHWYSWNAF